MTDKQATIQHLKVLDTDFSDCGPQLVKKGCQRDEIQRQMKAIEVNVRLAVNNEKVKEEVIKYKTKKAAKDAAEEYFLKVHDATEVTVEELCAMYEKQTITIEKDRYTNAEQRELAFSQRIHQSEEYTKFNDAHIQLINDINELKADMERLKFSQRSWVSIASLLAGDTTNR